MAGNVRISTPENQEDKNSNSLVATELNKASVISQPKISSINTSSHQEHRNSAPINKD